MSLIVKAYLGDQIRRIRVSSSVSFSDLENELKTAFELPSSSRIALKYLDEEGDRCVLSAKSLPDAVAIANTTTDTPTPLLKVHLSPLDPSTPTPTTPTALAAAVKDQLSLKEPKELTHKDMSDDEIKEWHFHVVFICTNAEQVRQAEALREKLVAGVAAGKLTLVCHGVTQEHYPGLNMARVPKVNLKPIGPHISGSYEVWVPKEGIDTALSFFTLNRGDVSILIHPLTRWEMADHTTRAAWIGTQFPLDLRPLVEDLGRIPMQYPELGMGYSKK